MQRYKIYFWKIFSLGTVVYFCLMKFSENLSVLKNIEFRHLLTGRFFIIIGFRMLATMLGWWVYQLTNDKLAIGIIGLSEVVPAVVTALYSGYVIDVREKKKLLLTVNILYVILISLLLIPALYGTSLNLLSWNAAYFIYAVIFLTGICRAFLGPLVPSMIPKMVKQENLAKAITLNQATFLSASVIGHALGGILIALIQISGTLFVVISLVAFSMFFFSKIEKQHPEQKALDMKPIEAVKEGFQYIYKTKEILGASLLDMFAVFFGGAVAMIPVFASDILKVGAQGFGILNAATDIGAVIVIIFLSMFPLKKNQGKILLAVVAGFGLCIIGFALSEWFWLSFILLMFSGILDGFSVVIRGTIVQLKTPEHIRGRVLSANSIFIMSSNEMGQFESGVAAKLMGLVPSVVFGGSMTVAIAFFVGLTNPKLRKMSYQ